MAMEFWTWKEKYRLFWDPWRNKTKQQRFKVIGNPLAVQWLGLHTSPRGTVESIPGGESRTLHATQAKTKINQFLKGKIWDFPGIPVVKNSSCDSGDVGLIPGEGIKIPLLWSNSTWALQLLSPWAIVGESVRCHGRPCVIQRRLNTAKWIK